MKKNDIIEVTINDLEFPNIGITIFEDKIIKLKNTLPGQKVRARVVRSRKDKAEAKVVEVLESASYEQESACEHSDSREG